MDNRVTRKLARQLMRSGTHKGYACSSCPRENFWLCTNDGADIVVCHPEEVLQPEIADVVCVHAGPYR